MIEMHVPTPANFGFYEIQWVNDPTSATSANSLILSLSFFAPSSETKKKNSLSLHSYLEMQLPKDAARLLEKWM